MQSDWDLASEEWQMSVPFLSKVDFLFQKVGEY